ncbi:Uma2 family endonuclease [Oscillatoria sp. CS-180]|uniref:Uma2 family endonuclease n=1 Tax=Oscillatoria sp. CS-180 TaxID=3021720 RepID=UPI00232BF852|nr:Uma2 family endonuclease [Oscillatoria sp. CS-180]MDB9524942.1 Uma2 family endonuclease [Oscillatoria sp. CS-180]
MSPALSKENETLSEAATSATREPVQSPSETRILLSGVSWETYERLLAETGEGRNQQFAYRDGLLEIVVPLEDHEEPTRLFEHFLAAFVDELALEVRSLGSLTMKNPQQRMGLEPDCCFYIQNEAAVRGLDKLDFEIHPPPDLVVEVDNSSSSLNKFPIYSALKVPEIWRLKRDVLTIYQLNQSQSDYEEVEQSLAFPQLPVPELPQFIARAKVIGQRASVRELAKRVRQVLAKQKSP